MRSLVYKAALRDAAVAIGSFTMLTIAMSICPAGIDDACDILPA